MFTQDYTVGEFLLCQFQELTGDSSCSYCKLGCCTADIQRYTTAEYGNTPHTDVGPEHIASSDGRNYVVVEGFE
jgi:hypothetical protein